jgi:hypothetical protein
MPRESDLRSIDFLWGLKNASKYFKDLQGRKKNFKQTRSIETLGSSSKHSSLKGDETSTRGWKYKGKSVRKESLERFVRISRG